MRRAAEGLKCGPQHRYNTPVTPHNIKITAASEENNSPNEDNHKQTKPSREHRQFTAKLNVTARQRENVSLGYIAFKFTFLNVTNYITESESLEESLRQYMIQTGFL